MTKPTEQKCGREQKEKSKSNDGKGAKEKSKNEQCGKEKSNKSADGQGSKEKSNKSAEGQGTKEKSNESGASKQSGQSGQSKQQGQSGPSPLSKLRALMEKEKLHALIVPTTDAHHSEYIAKHDNRRQWLTGFTGSVGTAVVTPKEAALWTDGRYFLQAERELDKKDWKLMKERMPDTPTISEWLCKALKQHYHVGSDPFTMTYDDWKKNERDLERYGIKLVATSTNLVDAAWGKDRPPKPDTPLVPLANNFCGKSWQDKVADVRKEMEKEGAGAMLLTLLDEIAWQFNLRASDIPFNPVFFAYSIISRTKIYLFIKESRITSEVTAHFSKGGKGGEVEVKPYESVVEYLKMEGKKHGKIWVGSRCNYALLSLIPEEQRHLTKCTPTYQAKAVKNPAEIEGMRRAHIKDAVALCELYTWIEDQLKNKSTITEQDVEKKLEELKHFQKDYIGPSFRTICGSGPNGALIHYHSSPQYARPISTSEMLLLDSGSQYRDGTTDVTRTVHFGTPSAFEREAFTRVVKGHIALAMAKFPRLTIGLRLDSFARRALWDVGLDYNHGTGHGVGHYLNVHEGPSSITYLPNPSDPGIVENMIFSNEPGYYDEGKFGIRIESLVVVKKVDTPHNFNDRGYLGFETITVVPIATKLLDKSLLTQEEMAWLNMYNKLCFNIVSKEMQAQGRTNGLQWLKRETEPIGRNKEAKETKENKEHDNKETQGPVIVGVVVQNKPT